MPSLSRVLSVVMAPPVVREVVLWPLLVVVAVVVGVVVLLGAVVLAEIVGVGRRSVLVAGFGFRCHPTGSFVCGSLSGWQLGIGVRFLLYGRWLRRWRHVVSGRVPAIVRA